MADHPLQAGLTIDSLMVLQSPNIKLQDERQLVLGLHSWND
jgi:hypothetical protein